MAYLPNSDTFVIDHYFHFLITNSTFHDYFRLLKVVDNIYECENQIFLVCDGQKWPNLTKKGSSTMLNLIVNCFSQFLRKIMPFLTLIPNFLALNLLVIENFVWNFIRGPYIDLSWVPSGSKLTLKRSKLCYKSQFYIIFLNYRASILGFDHLRHWKAFSLLFFCSQESKIVHSMAPRGSNVALRRLKK